MAQDWTDPTSTVTPRSPTAAVAAAVAPPAVAPARPAPGQPGQSQPEAAKSNPAAAVAPVEGQPGRRYEFEDQTATAGGFSARPRQAGGSTGKTGA